MTTAVWMVMMDHESSVRPVSQNFGRLCYRYIVNRMCVGVMEKGVLDCSACILPCQRIAEGVALLISFRGRRASSVTIGL